MRTPPRKHLTFLSVVVITGALVSCGATGDNLLHSNLAPVVTGVGAGIAGYQVGGKNKELAAAGAGAAAYIGTKTLQQKGIEKKRADEEEVRRQRLLEANQ